ncbi:MAG: hypothetical protein K0Q73_6208 [Paenibacillus sp.]|jgi:hypothetical protein|nr:hypothetical protein [Paenibacillus sp.]
MAVPNQYAIREIPLATFYDLTTGKARVQLQNLKTSGFEQAAETVYATGGRGNPKVVGFSGSRTSKLALQEAVFTSEVLAMMTGNPIGVGATPIYQRDVLTVSTNAATLKYTPAAAGALISVYKANADGTHGEELVYNASVAAGKYSVTAKALSFFAGDIANGDQVIAYYKVNTDASANKITVSADKFAGSYKVVLDCLVRDTFTKTDFAAQIVIPNAKMEDTWKVDMAPTGDPSVFDIPLEILKPANSQDMWTMTIYDGSLIS